MCVFRTGTSRTIFLLSGSSTNAHQLIYCAGLWVCEVCVCTGFPLENLSQKQDKEKLFQSSRLSWQHELHLSSSDLTFSSSSAPSQLLRLTSSLTFSDDKETLFFCTTWAATENNLSQVQMLQLWPSTCAACLEQHSNGQASVLMVGSALYPPHCSQLSLPPVHTLMKHQ